MTKFDFLTLSYELQADTTWAVTEANGSSRGVASTEGLIRDLRAMREEINSLLNGLVQLNASLKPPTNQYMN